ncbi:MAG: Bax inhibitor-1/YccA family protein [Bacilli bacterium]|nr:Bax inhibitor-1/YccA family protein [Bacilli bacterium]
MGNKLFSKVFAWMFIGLIITFATGFYVAMHPNMLYNIFSTGLHFGLLILEIVLVVWLSARSHKMKFSTASIVYVIYSVVTGLTFSSFFVIYELGSIMFIFALTALLFGIFALLGYTTNTDLTKFSTIFLMGLIGIILATIINIFLNNSMLEIIISWVSIILFLGITAHDIQKIKTLSNVITDENAIAIIGALDLYLDFINIFIDLIRIFGKTRD